MDWHNLFAVYEFHVQYWLYSSRTWKDWWEKVHPHWKLFISHDCHVQYRLHSNWTWKTGWKRMHPHHKLFIPHYQNCKPLTSRPLSVRPDSISKQACNGHMLHLIIQKPCPEIGFIYFIFTRAQAGGLWSGESKWITYTKEMHFGPCAPQTGLTLWLPFCPLPCFWLILFNYSLFNLPLPANIQNAFSPSRLW